MFKKKKELVIARNGFACGDIVRHRISGARAVVVAFGADGDGYPLMRVCVDISENHATWVYLSECKHDVAAAQADDATADPATR